MKKTDKVITFLGNETEFEGKLKFDGTIRIDGHFKGEIFSKGNLIIGEEGLVEADMHIAYVAISGEVHGNIIAEQRVDIHAPGKVFGNIQAPVVVIDEGVIFEGNTRMYQAKDAAEKKNSVVGSDQYVGGPPPNITAIYGIVKDEATGKPLKNARISTRGPAKNNTESNGSGYYELINLKQGKWKLKVEAKGYRKQKAEVTISSEGTYEQNFSLKPKT
ncbi:MAG: polymer-forming cytoskeletal protein [Deltaproteobacteria bacterium]|nr:polymer-forming cytoskeletal protein [Deltaproteobacteria bacterium]MBW1921149.1 polymer-forming cytoskeletal protein [Deltaproteobacteria bacterium]MBW1934968.1 polymer-forming cytoskeletal protein [Deltaproteobacteria bacterium]MBW1976834.1 polymer-forming cytoskeletal protein [Deltaproteobacteria bacterium]MBW2043725.1 polymer-forming cytoskeletal protein [Deltaproteobacteria bacterium]